MLLQCYLLLGVFFVVKDNIDVVGVFIIVVCLVYVKVAWVHVTVVCRLLVVGVLWLGKMNLD